MSRMRAPRHRRDRARRRSRSAARRSRRFRRDRSVIRTGVNYEGRDPYFVAAVLPFADVVEVTPDALATRRNGAAIIPDATLEELRAINGRAQITLHGIGLSIASADMMNESYFALTDILMRELDVAWHS